MLEAEGVRNLIGQIDAVIASRNTFRMRAGEVPGVTNNISRLNIAWDVLLGILEGRSFDITLATDELSDGTTLTFDPDSRVSKLTWWDNVVNRIEGSGKPNWRSKFAGTLRDLTAPPDMLS